MSAVVIAWEFPAYVRGLSSIGLFRQRTTAIRGDDVGQEEVGDSLVGIDLIFHAGEAVAFVFVDLIVDGPAALFDGIDYLLRF